MKHWMPVILALLLCLSAGSAAADDSMRYIYHRDPGSDDSRNAYAWRVLQAALDHTIAGHGAYLLGPGSITDERPNATSLLQGDGGITVSVFTARTGYEGKLIPVRIPIDRGILGYRLLLIHQADQAKFAGIRKLDDLKSLTFGGLVSWADVAIMRHAGLTVVTGPSFDGLFKMLAVRRFDVLSRGASEIGHDLDERRTELPDIVVERSLVLHYPLPVYFWFRDDREGKVLAQRVDLGLRQMVADGSLDALFHQEFDPILGPLDLAHRHVIDLDNPLLSAEEPLRDRALWYVP
jgi:ABC-type amino acid transport substrate-binding protein